MRLSTVAIACLLAPCARAQIGCQWQPVGAASFSNVVEDLVLFDDGSGESLYAVGRFPEIVARWDGSIWRSVGSPLGGYAVTAIVHDDGTGEALYIGGCLNELIPGGGSNRVFKLVGNAWQPVTGWSAPSFGSCVLCLDEFVIGGTRRLVAGTNSFSQGLVYRSGSAWVGVSTGANVLAMEPFDDGTGNALFLSLSPSGMVKWNGTTLSPASGVFGAGELRVLDLGEGPRLFAGSDGVYQWSGSAWTMVGGAFPISASVEALSLFDDGTGAKLYAGGRFSVAGGTLANSVARWNGSMWSPLGSGVAGGGLPSVRDLLPFDDGSGVALFAGGTFLQAGGVPATRIARWSCAQPPSFSSTSPCGQTLAASVGLPVSVTVEALAKTGLPANMITLTATGVPAGAVHSPSLPVTASGPSTLAATTLSWIPSNAQVGTHVLIYSATDQLGIVTQCKVRLIVAECYLMIGYGPANLPLGPGGDVLLVAPVGLWPVTMNAVPSFPIPGHSSLLGLSLFAQVAMFNPEVFPNDPLQLSHGLEVVLGQGCHSYGNGGSAMTLWAPQPPMLGASLTFGFRL